ncbi:YihA family ribosome biogenesis GTP-binding protein [candidate division KSB1 bacterium]|nr:YihA family ribosome biogenesis GTP-binding protein [candidate division KSB1 bacterium]
MKIQSVKFEKSVAHVSQLPKTKLPEIAFAGRSNVGKSSLINCLLNRKHLAKTSSTPGKTRLLNYFLINESFYFVDLPGYGFARVPPAEKEKWQQLVESYFKVSQKLRGVIIITDIRHPLTALDIEMIDWIKDLNIPPLFIGSKADKLSGNKLTQQLAENYQQLQQIYPMAELLPFSAITYAGRKEVWQKINNLL